MKMLVFLMFWEVLEGLERSARLIGRISSYFFRNQASWYRVMTKKLCTRVNRGLGPFLKNGFKGFKVVIVLKVFGMFSGL